MRKYLFFLLLLSLQGAARGQTGFDYRYWFDHDADILYEGHSADYRWQFEANLDGLSESLHAIHVQVFNANGVESSPVTRFFMKSHFRDVTKGYYWFDSDRSNQRQMEQVSGLFTVDVTSLSDGFHTFYYQVVGSDGSPSSIAARSFYKVVIPEAARYRCWVDNETATMTSGKYTGEPVLVDISSLSDGYHMMHVQIEGKAPSGVVTQPFIKVPQTEGVEFLKCLCMVDGSLYKEEDVPSTGGVIGWNLDVSALKQGFHKMQVQVITPSGAATSTYSSFFFRTTTHEELSEMKCVYAIDGNEFNTEAGKMSDGAFHCDLDVAHLSDGLHRIAYMLSNGKGVETKIQTQFFVKTPLGGNGITNYWYWLNKQADTLATKVTLAERTSPFSLITLLPVESQPLRSSLFQFRVEEGQPVIYAKNDLHVRFYDAAGRFTDATRQFVDESVKQEVTDVTLLNPGDSRKSARPGVNEIKWYKVTAERGDSLAFRTDYPCTVNVFSPNGEELYRASGADAVGFGGAYATETGSFYVALHDVTAQNGNNLTVEYQHIDKYAVVNYSHREMGVLPCGQVLSLQGNGMDKLSYATLCRNGQEHVAASVYAEGKTEADLLFALKGDEDKADYDLVLTFEDEGVEEKVTVANAVTLADPDFADFKIKITDPRTVGSPYPVSVSVTNQGNLTYSDIPFFMAYDNVEKITEMTFMDFDVTADTSLINAGLQFVYEVPNFKSKGIAAKVIPTIIPVLRPGETQTFRLGFIAGNHAEYNVYSWAGTPWSLYANETMAAIEAMAATGSGGSSSGDGSDDGSGNNPSGGSSTGSGIGGSGSGSSSSMTITLPGGYGRGAGGQTNGGVITSCVPDPCDIAGLAGGLAECLCGTIYNLGMVFGGIDMALQNRHNMAYNRQLAESGMFYSPDDYRPVYRLPHPGSILNNWLSHCQPDLPGKAGQAASAFNAAMDMMGEDPCPEPEQHGCNQYNPGDPNDIFGYLAESGSKYVGADVTDVYYAIEFENDPEIANASAHTIVVTDTLDKSRFDLSTFAATSVKLGTVEMKLNGEKKFSKYTMDLRPAIDVIAQVSLDFNETTGVAKWTIESLDPMSMEPTLDVMQGVLPVNSNGNGQGELTYDIQLKSNLAEGVEIDNRASIVFDSEGAIMTPTWTNIVDATAPESCVKDIRLLTDSTASVIIEATDNLSGLWRYDVYVQYGSESSWTKLADRVPADSVVTVNVYEGIDYGFYVVATDSAGNVEQKAAVRELSYSFSPILKGDVNGDGQVTAQDASLVLQHVAGKVGLDGADLVAADVNADGNVTAQDASLILQKVAGKSVDF